MANVKKVDINFAKLEDFESLIGVGHAKAESIIEHRKVNGPYSNITDLKQIPGIGPSILEQNRGLLTCSTAAPSSKTCAAKPGTSTDRETRRSARTEGIHSSSSCQASAAGDEAVPSSSCCHQPTTRSRSMVCSKRFHCPPVTRGAGRRQQQQTAAEEGTEDEEDEEEDTEEEVDEKEECDNKDALSEDNAEEEEGEDMVGAESMDYLDNDVDCGTGDNAGMSEGVLASLRSRASAATQAAAEKALMKRKCEAGGPNKDMSPGKKPCRLSEDAAATSTAASPTPSECGSSESGGCGGGGVGSPSHDPCQHCLHCSHCGQSTSPPPSNHTSAAAMAMMRKRIPSKTNPPPELANWLKTYQEWSHAERLLALDELIELCEVTEVRHMMAVIEPQFQRDFISLLPKELALHVLWYLEPRDLCRAAQTCRYWRILASDNLLWREKCKEEAISESTVFENSLRKRNPCSKNPWKGLYLRQKDIEYRWRSAPIKEPKVLKGHDDHVITCLEFCGSRIVSGSDDNTLKVWSAVTGKCLRTLVGHTGGVWSSQMAGHVIISGSTDRTLRVWHADTGQCMHVLYGHTSTVRCMCLHNNKVVSGSRDATLRMWDIETGECLHVLMGHIAAVRCVQYDGKRVVSGAYDYMVKIWDPDTETCLHTLQGHTNRVYSLQFDGTHIVSGSLDTSIRVWDVETGQSLHTLIGHQSLTSGMELKDSILVSGNADSTVKVWDIRTGHCLQTLQGPNKHQSAVTCLQFNRRFAVTSSDDGTVKLWSVRSGEFVRDLVRLESGGSGGVVWRLRCSNTKLVCAVGSRNGTEETKLLVLDFDVDDGAPVERAKSDSSAMSMEGSSAVARRLSLGSNS